jgi:hypothetical protein
MYTRCTWHTPEQALGGGYYAADCVSDKRIDLSRKHGASEDRCFPEVRVNAVDSVKSIDLI